MKSTILAACLALVIASCTRANSVVIVDITTTDAAVTYALNNQRKTAEEIESWIREAISALQQICLRRSLSWGVRRFYVRRPMNHTFGASVVSICRLALSAPLFAVLSGCASSPQRGEHQEVQKLRSQLRAAQRESQVRARADIEYFHVQNTECPIHHLHYAPMRVIRVPIAYGLILSTRPEPNIEVRHLQFPYARAFVFGGCLVSPDSPQHAKIYQCGECLQAEKAWYAAHPKPK